MQLLAYLLQPFLGDKLMSRNSWMHAIPNPINSRSRSSCLVKNFLQRDKYRLAFF
ncbi:MAG: hypothetical protein JWP57_845 [Spirosoma sp.]|nr:hypothetical protein [Spirosoma sp.]